MVGWRCRYNSSSTAVAVAVFIDQRVVTTRSRTAAWDHNAQPQCTTPSPGCTAHERVHQLYGVSEQSKHKIRKEYWDTHQATQCVNGLCIAKAPSRPTPGCIRG